MGETGKQSTKPLTYAPVDPRRRRWIPRTIASFLLAAAVLFAARSGPNAWRRLQIVFWQQRCLNYVNPSGSTATATAWPSCWIHLKQQLDGPGVIIANSPTVFCGQLANAAGQRRLLVIQPSPPAPKGYPTIYYALLEPSLVGTPRFVLRSAISLSQLAEVPANFAATDYTFAVRDAANPDHVSFDCLQGSRHLTLDVWISYDHAVFEVRGR